LEKVVKGLKTFDTNR